MPTPTGKPKIGEYIIWDAPYGSGIYNTRRRGRVLHRYDGLYWGVKVLWDGEQRPRYTR